MTGTVVGRVSGRLTDVGTTTGTLVVNVVWSFVTTKGTDVDRLGTPEGKALTSTASVKVVRSLETVTGRESTPVPGRLAVVVGITTGTSVVKVVRSLEMVTATDDDCSPGMI